MCADFDTVAAKVDQIEAEMRSAGGWQDKPLDPAQLDFRAAFGADTMAYTQWLQFIFIPNVRRIIEGHMGFPSASQVGAYAVREFDTEPNFAGLTTLLIEFDSLFG